MVLGIRNLEDGGALNLNDANQTETVTATAKVGQTSTQATIVGILFLVIFIAGAILFFMLNRRKPNEIQSFLGGSVMSEGMGRQATASNGLL